MVSARRTKGQRSAVGAAKGEFGPRILALADQLAQWSDSPDNLTVTYLTPAHRAVAGQLREWMQAAGMDARIDAVGNVVGHFLGDPLVNLRKIAARRLIVGSHYDTVRDAGKYDGRLGILTALVVIEHLNRTGRQLPYPLELIAFAEEEGVRFGASYIGSSAVAGSFDMDLLKRRDAADLKLESVMREAGFNSKAIPRLARAASDYFGYLEVHIEQGPVLLKKNLPVGIVTAIAGSVRHLVTITGAAGHAGTVPMAGRRDAAAAAAEIVLFVERRCAKTSTLVGTVGQLAVPAGAINVIPGRCELSIDIRAGNDRTRDAAVADVLAAIKRIGKRRGVAIEVTPVQRTPAVPCSRRLRTLIADAVKRAGIRPHRLPSGAGHDAVMFHDVTDIGMLFVRCGNGGVSHSPRETVSADDADVAARILLDVLLHLP